VTRRFLALGDSYTIGEGVGTAERWPNQLADRLRESGVSLADPRIIARTGWTTTELLVAVDTASPPAGRQLDLVSLLIGVNDQYRGLGVDAFRSGFAPLLDRAMLFAASDPTRVVVVSIPDWSVTPFAATDPRGVASIAVEIDEFNRVASEAALAAGAAFVDVTSDSRRALRDPKLLAADGLHPSAAMYASWVQLILPAARRTLTA
jgi:lysophospholipase L1-like esterase